MRDFGRILRCMVISGIIGGAFFYFTYWNGSRNAVAEIREPVQTETTGGICLTVEDFEVNIQYLYEYDIEALVVSTHDYRGSGLGTALSPKDLALAWGTVAEKNKDVNFHWRQSNRWYYWRVDTPQELGIAGGELRIMRQSSNNHIIPANDGIRQKVKYIRRGDYVRLKGYLVNIDGRKNDGSTFRWHSSTTRNDTGDGSCEVFYVTSVEWI